MMMPAMASSRQGSSLACPLALAGCCSPARNAFLIKASSASFDLSSNLTTNSPALWKPSQLASVASHLTPSGLLFHDHTSHDLLCTLAVFASSFVWIRFFDFLVQKNVLEQKLSRKLVHISTGILYALLWPVFSISPWSRYFALAIPFANAVRLLVYGLGIIKDEAVVKSISRSGSSRELLGGPFYYVVALSLCTVFFWRDSPVGIVALAVMCGGDGIADIIGRRLGSIKLPYNPSKSWVGSISMFFFSFAFSVSLLYYYSSLGFYQLNWSSAVQIVALISFSATIVESLPISSHLDDNMSVPLISVLMGSALFPGVLL
ncbi:hypothetical protein GOP47_0010050 [Adiantum capillus-veneris]|uniref:phytol kinase n=1 Tax=Adiantum capillus-veneris TaxID=13818 RepID=A0A9D4UU13_ADICA|nr:hypothetical protein GOP47_0010050 [Adiantum capillus-veneris]